MASAQSAPLSLFGSGDPCLADVARYERFNLDECCWVDIAHGFVEGADTLFRVVQQDFEWRRGRRLMYGTWHDEPRLSASPRLGDESVPPLVRSMVSALSVHYGRRFSGFFCNYYRSGEDSVAWHADRIGKSKVDPLVAILSLGGPRTFAMRDRQRQESERSKRWTLHSGDLLVMGGATQHHWEHSVPKAKIGAPRISLTTRAG